MISEDTVTVLHKENFLKLRNLPEPVEVELGDGTIKRISQLVSMDTELVTPAGSIMLKRLSSGFCLFWPDWPKRGLARLELPSLEDSLEAAVAKAKSGEQATDEVKSKGNLILTNVLMPTEIVESNSTWE